MRRLILLLSLMAVTLVVASGVVWAVTMVGTNGDDHLIGTNRSDKLVGMGGNDLIRGRGGKDVILGGRGDDYDRGLYGGSEADDMSGGPGHDYVFGGGGADVLKGGLDNDWVDAQESVEQDVDRLRGGRGKDFLTAFNSNARRDIVRCGAGRDRAVVDSKDIVADDCERVEKH